MTRRDDHCQLNVPTKINNDEQGEKMTMQRFTGKVVVVTGAGSGIGEATARRFSQEGACVVLAGRTKASLEAVAADLPDDRTLVCKTDVSDFDDVEKLIAKAVKKFGRLDVLVNNAGVAAMGTVVSGKMKDWEKIQAINVNGVFFGARAAMPHLIESRGCIVNVASVSGLGGDWGLAFYNASKGAVVNLTRAMAMDHGADGVRVNAVCPSLTITPMTSGISSNEATLSRFSDRIPLGRGAEPAEVAAAIAFLASDDASFISGVNLPVDGGLGASNGQPRLG
jgi:meso-butanediol dehydrogenase/(S,S)-butanediol dehydrogenase/diacetyl reductase